MIDKILYEDCPVTTNHIPYELLLKGWDKLNLREKLIWKFYEFKQRFLG